MDIKIVADSLCDLPEELLERYDIDVVALNIYFGESSYKDGLNINKKEFYDKLKESKETPSTSQVNPSDFEAVFEKYPDRTILYIGGSSAASGTYQSGVIAKNSMDDMDIHTFDTMALSMGCGLLVLKAAEMAKNGRSIDEIISMLEKMKPSVVSIFTVDTLEYLERGGRISKTKALLGTVLSIKPVLTVENGLVTPMDSVRGKKKVNEKFISIIQKDNLDLEGITISVCHADNEAEAEKLAEEIKGRLHPQEIIISEIGAAIGTHCGPGTLAVFYAMDK